VAFGSQCGDCQAGALAGNSLAGFTVPDIANVGLGSTSNNCFLLIHRNIRGLGRNCLSGHTQPVFLTVQSVRAKSNATVPMEAGGFVSSLGSTLQRGR
jgi:hypothetical protein